MISNTFWTWLENYVAEAKASGKTSLIWSDVEYDWTQYKAIQKNSAPVHVDVEYVDGA